METLSGVLSVLAALSVATERFVEIVKGLVPYLNKAVLDDPVKEARRRAALQIIAVVSGVITAFAAKFTVPAETELFNGYWDTALLGLLAAGGSGFWNSVQGWFLGLKDDMKAAAEQRKLDAELKRLHLGR